MLHPDATQFCRLGPDVKVGLLLSPIACQEKTPTCSDCIISLRVKLFILDEFVPPPLLMYTFEVMSSRVLSLNPLKVWWRVRLPALISSQLMCMPLCMFFLWPAIVQSLHGAPQPSFKTSEGILTSSASVVNAVPMTRLSGSAHETRKGG